MSPYSPSLNPMSIPHNFYLYPLVSLLRRVAPNKENNYPLYIQAQHIFKLNAYMDSHGLKLDGVYIQTVLFVELIKFCLDFFIYERYFIFGIEYTA